MREVGERVKALDAELRQLEEERKAWRRGFPICRTNPCRRGGHVAETGWCAAGRAARVRFEPKPHWDLATRLGLLDFEPRTKIAGAASCCSPGGGARSSGR